MGLFSKSVEMVAEESGVQILHEKTIAKVYGLHHSSCVLNTLVHMCEVLKTGEYDKAIVSLSSIKNQKRECQCCYCVASSDFDAGPILLCIHERRFLELLTDDEADAALRYLNSRIKPLAPPTRYEYTYCASEVNFIYAMFRTRLSELSQMLVVSKMLKPTLYSSNVADCAALSMKDTAPEVLRQYWAQVYMNNVWLRSRQDLVQHGLDSFSSRCVSNFKTCEI